MGFALRGNLTDDVDAFGYNSSGSEPISMKSGALRVHCWQLAVKDFWAQSAQ